MQIVEKNMIADRPRSDKKPSLGSDKQLHDLFSVILGEYASLHSGDHLIHNKLIGLEERHYLQQFKGWCMPEQPVEYIKSRNNDFL